MVSGIRSSVCMESSTSPKAAPQPAHPAADAFSVVKLTKELHGSSRSSPKLRSIRTAPMHSNPPDNSRSGPHSQPDRKGPFKGVQDFEWRRIIGAGTFGRVCHCIVRDGPHAGQMVAIKSISKSFALCQGQVSHLKLEKSLLSLLQHRFIVSYYGSFQDEEFVYLVLEYVSGGDFFKLLREQTKRVQDSASNDSVVSMDMDEKKIKICLPEAEARFYAGQILLALSYLSTLDICYRDLKPENILVTESGYLKLTDFGFAKRLHNSKTFTFCGTPDYMAPEIVSGKAMHGYGIECDLWSLGATIYEMLCGQPPFWTGNAKMTYAKILNSNQWLDWNFAHECPDISNEAKDLIRGLMHPDPSERYGSRGIKQVFEHPWFRGFSFSLLWKQAYRAPVTREQEPGRLTTHFECFDLKPYVHPKLPEGFTPAYMAQVFSCF